MMMMKAPVLEREIVEIFRDDDNHDHAAAAAPHNSYKNTRTHNNALLLDVNKDSNRFFAETMRW